MKKSISLKNQYVWCIFRPELVPGGWMRVLALFLLLVIHNVAAAQTQVTIGCAGVITPPRINLSRVVGDKRPWTFEILEQAPVILKNIEWPEHPATDPNWGSWVVAQNQKSLLWSPPFDGLSAKQNNHFKVRVKGEITGCGSGGIGGLGGAAKTFDISWEGDVSEICGDHEPVTISFDEYQPVFHPEPVDPTHKAIGTTTWLFTKPTYDACKDAANGVWRLRVVSAGGAGHTDIYVGYFYPNVFPGSPFDPPRPNYRNPSTHPPTTEDEAVQAVQNLNTYFLTSSAYWYVKEATVEHERYHYTEFKTAAEHYWPQAVAAMENISVPIEEYATKEAALKAMTERVIGSNQKSADVMFVRYVTAVGNYLNNLQDNQSNPGWHNKAYAAGQIVLNAEIAKLQALAAQKGWTLPAMENPTPDTSNPNPLPYPPFVAWPGG